VPSRPSCVISDNNWAELTEDESRGPIALPVLTETDPAISCCNPFQNSARPPPPIPHDRRPVRPVSARASPTDDAGINQLRWFTPRDVRGNLGRRLGEGRPAHLQTVLDKTSRRLRPCPSPASRRTNCSRIAGWEEFTTSSSQREFTNLPRSLTSPSPACRNCCHTERRTRDVPSYREARRPTGQRLQRAGRRQQGSGGYRPALRSTVFAFPRCRPPLSPISPASIRYLAARPPHLAPPRLPHRRSRHRLVRQSLSTLYDPAQGRASTCRKESSRLPSGITRHNHSPHS